MNLYFVLFNKYDCFLCKFYAWVKSFFVYEAPDRTGRWRDSHTSPFEHFTMYHPELLFIFIALIFVAIFVFCIWASKSTTTRELASERFDSTVESKSNETVQITLYGFKTVSLELGKEYYPELPEREGYAFTGWFYDPSFTKPFMPGKKLKKDITLYPRWQKE